MINKNIQVWSAESNRLVFNGVLFALPIFVLLWLSGVWICYVLLLILYHTGSANKSYFEEIKAYQRNAYIRYITYVFIGYFIFSLIAVFFLKSPLKSIDSACIFLLWLAISPVIAILQPCSKILGYGCATAASMALILAIVQFHFYNIERPYGAYGTGFPGSGAIKFGDIALLIGIFAFLLLPNHKYKLGFIGLISGLVVCLYAGARGGILAAIICAMVWLLTGKAKKIVLKNVLLALLVIALFVFFLNNLMGNHILHRILHTKDEFDFFNRDNLNTSSGIRLQMWKAAILIFKEHPILGVGLNNYDDALLALYKKGLVSKLVIIFSHAHNEYICVLATGGILGFFMTIAILGVPANYFRHYCQQTVWAAVGFWGISLMAGFALTDCIFDRRMTVIMFILLITICMAGCMQENNQTIPAKGNRVKC